MVVVLPKDSVLVNKDALPVVMLPKVRVELYNGCHVFSWDGGASVVKQYQLLTLWIPSLI